MMRDYLRVHVMIVFLAWLTDGVFSVVDIPDYMYVAAAIYFAWFAPSPVSVRMDRGPADNAVWVWVIEFHRSLKDVCITFEPAKVPPKGMSRSLWPETPVKIRDARKGQMFMSRLASFAGSSEEIPEVTVLVGYMARPIPWKMESEFILDIRDLSNVTLYLGYPSKNVLERIATSLEMLVNKILPHIPAKNWVIERKEVVETTEVGSSQKTRDVVDSRRITTFTNGLDTATGAERDEKGE